MPTREGPTATPISREEYDRRVARAMTEKVLEERVRQLANALRWRRYHTLRPKGSPAGFPDDVLVRLEPTPRLIFAELKTETGKTSPDQNAWLEDLRAVAAEADAATGYGIGPDAGPIEVYVWRPTDLLNGTIAAVLA